MDESAVTWQAGRKGWMGRARREVQPPPVPIAPDPTPLQAVPAVVIVPQFPCFSPAAAAKVLRVHRGTLHNWIERGKLECFLDNIGERYVMREELIRFVREYLKCMVQN